MGVIHSDVAIIGGGLVGTWTAYFLRQRGHSVTVIEKGAVGCFHELVTSGQILLDPARDVHQPVRRHSAAFLEPSVHRRGVAVAKVLDDHEQWHVAPPAFSVGYGLRSRFGR